MKEINNFLFAGGDTRQIYAGERLKKEGFGVSLLGFDLYSGEKPQKDFLRENGGDFDAFILPLPISRDRKNITAPFSSEKIRLRDFAENLPEGKAVFCGRARSEERELFKNQEVFDYSAEEYFKIMNAVPTAEGILAIALENLKTTVKNAEILVLGYGKTGEAVSSLLKAAGAEVTVGARKKESLALAKARGFKTLLIDESFSVPEGFHMAVNTVPAVILKEKQLLSMRKTIIAEAASPPYGIDFTAASRLGVKVISAPGLPGKYAPETAGEIIAETIINMIKEEG